MTYDVIVIGVGGMGSAAIYHLAKRKVRVLGLEQFDIPHDFGSSHGVNRIIRLAYYEGAGYVPLLRRAYELWRHLELVARERLLMITGSIDAGTANSRIVTGSIESCQKNNLTFELLSSPELAKRHPGYQLPPDMLGIYQPDGGFLLSERCIVAHVEAAQALGAAVRAREQVLGWDLEDGGVAVRTGDATYHARKLVITAGPWAKSLLDFLGSNAIPERQVLIWTQPLKPESFKPENFPVFNLEAQDGRFYGFPVFGVPGFKIGKYHHRNERLSDPTQVDRNLHPEDEKVLRDGIQRYFPEANGPTMAMKTCLFTNSPDDHFIIDHHPESKDVCLAAGFSGHGYKFCSVVGEIMAQLVLDGRTQHDISDFSLKRPSLGYHAPPST